MHKTSDQSSGSVKKYMRNTDTDSYDGVYLSGILDLEYGDTVIFVVFP